jgi:hypothetical protein
VLVDEVEPEEAVAVLAAGVADAGEDVPGGGDGEKEYGAGERLEAAPVAILTGEGEVGDGGSREEDNGDQALGEDGEGERGPHEVGVKIMREKGLRGRGAVNFVGILRLAQDDGILGWR